jgi:tetratricopeptide (TPR) repeat protein
LKKSELYKFIFLVFLIISAQSPKLTAQSLQGQELIDTLKADLLKTNLDSNRAQILIDISVTYEYLDSDKGIEFGKKAEELSKKIGWQKGLALSYFVLAGHFETKSEYETAIGYYYKSIQLSKSINLEKNLAGSYNNIGKIFKSQGDYDKAVEYYKKSLKIKERINDKKGIANSLSNIGSVYLHRSNYSKALELINRSLLIEEEIGNVKGAVISLGTIGNVYYYLEDYDQSLKYYLKALEKSKELENNLRTGWILDNIGLIHKEQKNYTKALEYLNKSLEINSKLGKRIGYAKTLGDIGTIYYLQSKYPLALDYYYKALKIKKELGDKRGVAMTTNNIGALYLELSDDNIEIKPNESNTYLSIIKENTLEKAIINLRSSVNIYEEIGDLNSSFQTWYSLAKAFKIKGDHKLRAEALEQYQKIKDSVFNIEKAKEIASLNAVREKFEKEKEIELLKQREQAEKEKSELITYSAIGGIGLVGIFAFLIWMRFRREKKLSNELDKQKNAVEQANIELETQQKQLEKNHYELVDKNEEILASIRYAQTIQDAMLPWDSELKKHLKNYFLIFKPKDIVSGDFYWFKEIDGMIFIAVADCTGHGIPGSMLSIMGSSILDEAVLTQGLRDTDKILNELNLKMIEGLNKRQDLSDNRDGMDVCLIRIIALPRHSEASAEETSPVASHSERSEESSKNRLRLQFSGAKRPLYLLQSCELQTIKGDKNSIAGERYLEDNYFFSKHDLEIESGTKLILTSDGFADQIGTNGKKFGTKRLKAILSENLSIQETNQKLEQEFTSHIGSEEQRDDVTIMGVEI